MKGTAGIPVFYPRSDANSVLLPREEKYVVKIIQQGSSEVDFVYRLRYQIFSESLGWVPANEHKMERDSYDEKSIFYGVFDGAKLLAFIRLTPFPHNFMVEHEFKSLVSDSHVIRKEPDTAETSRVCVAPEARALLIDNKGNAISIVMMLFKAVYSWCRQNNVRYIYTVVEARMLRFLQRKGFPCRLIGTPCRMEDGVTAAAVSMDWQEFEVINRIKRPLIMDWFSNRDRSYFKIEGRIRTGSLDPDTASVNLREP